MAAFQNQDKNTRSLGRKWGNPVELERKHSLSPPQLFAHLSLCCLLDGSQLLPLRTQRRKNQDETFCVP